jgi:hypothetical protein
MKKKTCCTHEHMFKVSIDILKTVDVVSVEVCITQFCYIMSPEKNNGLIHTKNMSRTSTLHAKHMYQVSSQYLKNCRSRSRHKILLNRAPLRKIMDWSTWEKKLRKCTHEHMFKVCIRYLENCWRSKCRSLHNTILLNNAPLQPKMDWSIENMSLTCALHAEHIISVSSRYVENCRSLHNMILLNHVPCKKEWTGPHKKYVTHIYTSCWTYV